MCTTGTDVHRISICFNDIVSQNVYIHSSSTSNCKRYRSGRYIFISSNIPDIHQTSILYIFHYSITLDINWTYTYFHILIHHI